MFDNTQVPATQIQVKHHQKCLDLRAQDRIVQSSWFAEAWTLASTKQREVVIEYINDILPQAVREWVSVIMIETLDRCTIKMLRGMASYNRIRNYSRLTKAELLDALQQKGVK